MADPQFALAKQMDAAKVLREQLADLAAGDPDFIRDAIEGETDLHEQIGALVASITEDEALADGIKRLMEDHAARKKRIEGRAEIKRALVASAMEIGELRTIRTPAGTVSLNPVRPKLVPTSEAEIPSRFWKTADPTLDRNALWNALKARAAAIDAAGKIEDPDERADALARVAIEHPEIPGAELSNGSVTIAIRSK